LHFILNSKQPQRKKGGKRKNQSNRKRRMAGVGEEKALRKIAAAFEPLADVATSAGAAMEVGPFSHACAHVSVLFGCLGIAFKFAEKDYVSKAWRFPFL
jgi:ribosomal protein S8E